MDVSPDQSPTGYRPDNDSDPRTLLFAGVLGAGAFSFLVCGPHRPHSLSVRGVVASAIGCVFLVLVAYSAILWAVALIWRRENSSKPHSLFTQTAFAVVWFAPLSLLLQQQSAWAPVISLALGATLALSLCILLDRPLESDSSLNDLGASPPNIFSFVSAPLLCRDLILALTIGLCAELAIVTSLADQTWPAAFLSCIAAGLFVRSFYQRVLRNRDGDSWNGIGKKPRTLFFAFAVIAMALSLTPYLRYGGGAYDEGFTRSHKVSGTKHRNRRQLRLSRRSTTFREMLAETTPESYCGQKSHRH